MLDKKFDVVALGELLIDFTENDISVQGNPLFEANPGGAPCNVLSMLSKLGKKTSFIGKVGNDRLGIMLKTTLVELGIDVENLIIDENAHTTLAFIHTLSDGDREFSFYRNPGADMMLKESEIMEDLIASSKIFHFGTLSMTHNGVRQATKRALKIAKANESLISFDPNIREPLWESMELAKEQVLYGLNYCDVLKISDNEIQWLTGVKDFTEGVKRIRSNYDIKLILVSMGNKGSRAYYGSSIIEVEAFMQDNTIDTTGAGDTFFACILNYILEHGLESLTEKDLKVMLTYANAAASIITTRKGALKVMPSIKEIDSMLSSVFIY